MAVYFSLTRKGETQPTPLAHIDNEICAHFHVTPDPVKYYEQWYDVIGFSIACGRTQEEILAKFDGTYANDARLTEIAEYIFANYTPNSWGGFN